MNQAIIAAISFCVVFGLQLVLQQLYLQSSIHPLHLIFLTNSLSFVLLTVYSAIFNRSVFRVRLTGKLLLWFLLATLGWIIADLSVVFGLALSSSVNFSLLSRLQIFITYFGAVLFLKERMNNNKLFAVVLSFVGGIIIVYNVKSGVVLNTGDVLFMVFTIAISVSSLLRQKVTTVISSHQMTYLMFGISAVSLGVITSIVQPIRSFDMSWFIVIISIMGLVGFTLVNYSISKGGATLFSVVSSLLPLFAAVFSFFILRELPMPNQLIGGMIIIISIFLFVRKSA